MGNIPSEDPLASPLTRVSSSPLCDRPGAPPSVLSPFPSVSGRRNSPRTVAETLQRLPTPSAALWRHLRSGEPLIFDRFEGRFFDLMLLTQYHPLRGMTASRRIASGIDTCRSVSLRPPQYSHRNHCSAFLPRSALGSQRMGVHSRHSAQYASGSPVSGTRRGGDADGGAATAAASCSVGAPVVRLRTIWNKSQFNFTGLSGMITPFRDGRDGNFSLSYIHTCIHTFNSLFSVRVNKIFFAVPGVHDYSVTMKLR